MKRILITGANSYIGMSFEKYIENYYSKKYKVDTVDLQDDNWRKEDFYVYNAVFHVAGLAHVRECEENRALYYRVNRDLAIETAQKAKTEGVEQFIFLSSMSVYGMDIGTITIDTVPCPHSHYGKSKLEAESEIEKLKDERFKVCILRPPMVYGKNCKGNFNTVVKIMRKSPVFPLISNKRSMIYIDNLCEYVARCLEKLKDEVCFPQNQEYVNTSQMAFEIGKCFGKKCKQSKFLGALIKLTIPHLTITTKAFGTLIYKDMEDDIENYCVVDFKESIERAIRG